MNLVSIHLHPSAFIPAYDGTLTLDLVHTHTNLNPAMRHTEKYERTVIIRPSTAGTVTLLAVTFDFDCDFATKSNAALLCYQDIAGEAQAKAKESTVEDESEMQLTNARWYLKMFAKTAVGVKLWQKVVDVGDEVGRQDQQEAEPTIGLHH
jgi:hypothetical protein